MVLTRKCKLNPYALQSIKSENVGKVFGRVQGPSSIVICNSVNVILSLLPPVKSQGNPRNRGMLEGLSSAVLEEGLGGGGHYGAYLDFGAEPEFHVSG